MKFLASIRSVAKHSSIDLFLPSLSCFNVTFNENGDFDNNVSFVCKANVPPSFSNESIISSIEWKEKWVLIFSNIEASVLSALGVLAKVRIIFF